jgi:hypothetical protein
MLRFESWIRRVVVALAAGILLQQASAQEPPTDIQGPTYAFEKIRNKEISGVRLSMTPQQAVAALQTQGWQGYVEEDHAYLANGRENVWLQFPKIGSRRRLTYFSYTRNLSPQEWSDIEQRRKEALDLLGVPTIWTKWVRFENDGLVIGDRLYFGYERDTDAREDARECLHDWQCKAFEENKDCRPMVRQLQGGTIEAGFGYRSFHVTVRDDELNAAELLQDRTFRRWDKSKMLCLRPMIH